VFRALVWTLQQRRYAALAAAGLVFALICVGLGTFEIHRYHEKRHDNGLLRTNAHAPVIPLTSGLVPLTGSGRAPDADAIQYRRVSISGRFVTDREQYVANRSEGGRQGFDVLTPLRSGSATVLVMRGFVAATAEENRPADVPAAPSGVVQLTGWLEPAQTSADQFGRLGHGEIMSVNPSEQAARLGTPVYEASLTLPAGQPGTARLTALPLPDLGNPTGGAAEWQLLSYVIQWYAFAVLALLMPFLVSRSEVREARRRYLGIDESARQLDDMDEPRQVAGEPAGSGAGQLVARGRGELARRAEISQRVERAARLADRYGRSLGLDPEGALATAPPEPASGARQPVVRDSSAAVHRSSDEYHASYNDYLWQLALADGGLPELIPEGEPRRIEPASGPDDDSTSDGEVPVR
jgi:cytochrome oxidase assembly protein ShyY1